MYRVSRRTRRRITSESDGALLGRGPPGRSGGTDAATRHPGEVRRQLPPLWRFAAAFAAADFVSSGVSAPGCGRIARLLWFMRPLASAWVNYVIGAFHVVFAYAFLLLVLVAVASSFNGGRFVRHVAATLGGAMPRMAISILLGCFILHLVVQSLVAGLC